MSQAIDVGGLHVAAIAADVVHAQAVQDDNDNVHSLFLLTQFVHQMLAAVGVYLNSLTVKVDYRWNKVLDADKR